MPRYTVPWSGWAGLPLQPSQVLGRVLCHPEAQKGRAREPANLYPARGPGQLVGSKWGLAPWREAGSLLPLTEWAEARRKLSGPAEEPRPTPTDGEVAGREVPLFQQLGGGKGRAGTGRGGEGSHLGYWVHLFSLCGVQRC